MTSASSASNSSEGNQKTRGNPAILTTFYHSACNEGSIPFTRSSYHNYSTSSQPWARVLRSSASWTQNLYIIIAVLVRFCGVFLVLQGFYSYLASIFLTFTIRGELQAPGLLTILLPIPGATLVSVSRTKAAIRVGKHPSSPRRLNRPIKIYSRDAWDASFLVTRVNDRNIIHT